MNSKSSIQQDYFDFWAEHSKQKRNVKNLFARLSKDSYPASVLWANFHRSVTKFGYKPQKIKPRGSQGVNEYQDVPMCPCCSNKIVDQPLQLCYPTSPPSSIREGQNKFLLGSGICLFFMFIKMCIYYLLLRFIISDAFNIYSNLHGHYCKINPQKCTTFIQSVLAGYNKHTFQDEPFLNIMDYLNFILVIISIVYFTYYRKVFEKVHIFLDSVNLSDDDYSIFVQKYPITQSNQFFDSDQDASSIEKSLVEYINNLFQKQILKKNSQYQKQYSSSAKNKQLPLIASVSLCFDTSQFNHIRKIKSKFFKQLLNDQPAQKQFDKIYTLDFQEQKQTLKKKVASQKKQLIEQQLFQLEHKKIKQIFQNNFRYRVKRQQFAEQRDKIVDSNIRKYLKLLKKVDDLTYKACRRYSDQQNNHTFFIGKAFVTFHDQNTKILFLNQYKKRPQIFKINNHKIILSNPAEPNDIIWQNLKITTNERRQSILLSVLILFMSIGFSFVFTLITQDLQIYITSKIHQYNQNIDSSVAKSKQTLKIGQRILQSQQLSNLFNTIMIILTKLINLILSVIITKVTDLQRHKSKTDKIQIMIRRLVISKFLNTSIIYFTLYMVNSSVDVLSQNGLMNKLIKLVTLGALIDISLNLIQPASIIKHLYYSYQYRNVSYVNKSQEQLNRQLSFTQFNFVQRYSYYIVQIYLASFYAYLCPLAVPLLIITLIIQYWLDKYNLFRRSSANNSIGFRVTQITMKFCSYSILISSLGNVIFYQIVNMYLQFKFTIFSCITLAISLVYFIFVYAGQKRIKNWLQGDQKYADKQSYQQFIQKNPFSSTYVSQNPISSLLDRNNKQIRPSFSDQHVLQEQSLQMMILKSFQTVKEFHQIFLPYELDRYWKWNNKYQIIKEYYNKKDQDLFEKYFLNQNSK